MHTSTPVADAATRAMLRYADGDESAFGELYDALVPRVSAYLGRLTNDRALTDDLVQQTFLRIHDARSRFADGSSAIAWAFAIARNLYVDELRKRRRERTIAIDPADEQPQTLLVDRAADPERSAYGSELQRALHGHVNALPDAQREALRLVREEGLTTAEAAAVLGTSSAAVKLRVHRAYASLRSALARLIGEGGKL